MSKKYRYNREARRVLYELSREMVYWDDVVLEAYYDKPAKEARDMLVKLCNRISSDEREQQMREIEDNLPF